MNITPPEDSGQILWEYKPGEIILIARRQKQLLFLILIGIGLALFNGAGTALLAPPGTKDVPTWFSVVSYLIGIPYLVAKVICLFRLGNQIDEGRGWIYALLSIIPFIGIITLLYLNHKATRIIRALGLRVGLMGVSEADLQAVGQAPPRTE